MRDVSKLAVQLSTLPAKEAIIFTQMRVQCENDQCREKFNISQGCIDIVFNHSFVGLKDQGGLS